MNYIPHSLIVSVATTATTTGVKILIETKKGNYTSDYFTTDANGISGSFIKS